MSKSLQFVWGPGGVGKTHFSIRRAFRSQNSTRILSLDPSLRLFEILNLERKKGVQEKFLKNRKIEVRQTDVDHLFERLHQNYAASESVRSYYYELVKGLHRFRDYLCLIDLAEEIQSQENFDLIIDTPPLSEARGLTHSIRELHQFFRSPVFKLSLRSSLFQMSFRKAMDFTKSFIGKLGVEQAIEFVEWLNHHLESFKESTDTLENLLHRSETSHFLVLSPETSFHQLELAKSFFSKLPRLQIILNRSTQHLPDAPKEFPSLYEELQSRRKAEEAIVEKIQKIFPDSRLSFFPLILMGEDTEKELLRFLETEDRYIS